MYNWLKSRYFSNSAQSLTSVHGIIKNNNRSRLIPTEDEVMGTLKILKKTKINQTRPPIYEAPIIVELNNVFTYGNSGYFANLRKRRKIDTVHKSIPIEIDYIESMVNEYEIICDDVENEITEFVRL